MKIKLTYEFKEFCSLQNNFAEALQVHIIMLLKQCEIVPADESDENLCYGKSILQCMTESNGDLYIFLSKLNINNDELDLLLDCVIIGDGDCPECGGDLIQFDSEGKEITNLYSDSEFKGNIILICDVCKKRSVVSTTMGLLS